MNKSLRKILLGAAVLGGTMMPMKQARAANNVSDGGTGIPWDKICGFAIGFVAGGAFLFGRDMWFAWREDKRFRRSLQNVMGDEDYQNDNIQILHFDTDEIQDRLNAKETRIIVEDDQGRMRVGGTLKRDFFEDIVRNITTDSQKQR